MHTSVELDENRYLLCMTKIDIYAPETTDSNNSPLSAVRFEQFFTLEQYTEAAEFLALDMDDSERGDKAVFRAHMDLLDEAVTKFMAALFDAGVLERIEHTERRGIRFADAWNRMLDGDRSPYTVDTVAQPLAQDLFTALMRAKNQSNRGPVSMVYEYNRLCASYSSGSFLFGILVDSPQVCDATGLNILTYIRRGWRPALVERKSAGPSWKDGFTYSRVGPTPAEDVIKVTIPAPSGKLLVADWFRFEGGVFSNIVDSDENNFDINTGHGRQKKTEHYAREHGFLSICVGNTSPGVFRRKDHDLLGSSDGELPSAVTGEEVASVCTDLWWATIIDEEVLRRMVIVKLGEVDGQAAFDDFIAEGSFEAFTVEPGSLHAYFTAQSGALSRFRCETTEVSRRGFYDVHAVLSQKELTWAPCAPGEDPCPSGRSKRTKP